MRNDVKDMALLREGVDWVDLMISGAATNADAAALRCWCDKSPEHARAFHQAVAFRDALIQLKQEELGGTVAPFPRRRSSTVSRRAVLGGGFAVAAAAAGLAIVHPPLALWPSLAELRADFRTEKGEQRSIAFAQGVAVTLNTQTSLQKRNVGGRSGFVLVKGEVAVKAVVAHSSPLEIFAAAGKIVAAQAEFNIRYDNNTVCVTCIGGGVLVDRSGGQVALQASQQIAYSPLDSGEVVNANPALVTAWRDGLIVLRDVTLDAAVAEINRYRSGVIVIGSDALRAQRVDTVLQLAQIDQAVNLICAASGAHATQIGEYVWLT